MIYKIPYVWKCTSARQEVHTLNYRLKEHRRDLTIGNLTKPALVKHAAAMTKPLTGEMPKSLAQQFQLIEVSAESDTSCPKRDANMNWEKKPSQPKDATNSLSRQVSRTLPQDNTTHTHWAFLLHPLFLALLRIFWQLPSVKLQASVVLGQKVLI